MMTGQLLLLPSNRLVGTSRIRALKLIGSCKIRHACRARCARLKSSVSRNPSPPRYFGFIISSQETQQVRHFPSLLPHQKLHSKVFMWWQRPLGSLKQAMEYVGIACATTLIRTSFSAADKSISIQPCTLFQTRSLRYLKAPFAEVPTSEGTFPDISHSRRYYEQWPSPWSCP